MVKKDLLQIYFWLWNPVSLFHSPLIKMKKVLLLSSTWKSCFSEWCVGLVQQAKVSQGWMCHCVAVTQGALVTLTCKLGSADPTGDESPPEVRKVPWGLWLYWSPFTVNKLFLPLWAKWKLVWADHWDSVSGYTSKIHVCEKYAYISDKRYISLSPFPKKSCISATLLTPDLFLIKHLDTCLPLKHLK